MLGKIMLFYVFFLFGCTHQPKVEEKHLKRVALVIGNQNYKNNRLENPIKDAKAMKSILEGIGFDVTLLLDSTLNQLNQGLREVESKIVADKTLVFIYFAGHGNTLQKNSSEQFLMMLDEKETRLVSIFKFYDFVKKTSVKHTIIAIDACRDYEKNYIALNKKKNGEVMKNFRGNFRVGNIRHDNGVEVNTTVILDNDYAYALPDSILVSYATDRNQKAKDWSIYDENHSPYSYALLQHLDDEEIPIGEVFRRVRVSLLKDTNRTQSNTEEIRLEENIWLVPQTVQIAFTSPI